VRSGLITDNAMKDERRNNLIWCELHEQRPRVPSGNHHSEMSVEWGTQWADRMSQHTCPISACTRNPVSSDRRAPNTRSVDGNPTACQEDMNPGVKFLFQLSLRKQGIKCQGPRGWDAQFRSLESLRYLGERVPTPLWQQG